MLFAIFALGAALVLAIAFIIHQDVTWAVTLGERDDALKQNEALTLENLELADDLARYKGAWEAMDRMADIEDQMLVDDLVAEIDERMGG